MKDRPVVVEGGLLALERLKVAQHQLHDVREGQGRAPRRRSIVDYPATQLSLGLGAVQTVIGPTPTFRPQAAVDPPIPQMPAAVPDLVAVGPLLGIKGAGAVGTAASRGVAHVFSFVDPPEAEDSRSRVTYEEGSCGTKPAVLPCVGIPPVTHEKSTRDREECRVAADLDRNGPWQ